MGNVNKVFLMGNLTREPELRSTPNGASVCEFGMATNRTYKTKDGQQHDDTCFVDVTMWGRRGEVVAEYFHKGDPIFVEGRLTYNSWEKDGVKRSKLTVVADDFQFVGGRADSEKDSRLTNKTGDSTNRTGDADVSKGRHISTSAEDSANREPSPRFPDDEPVKDNEVPF